jgi:hypothetical protein
MFPLLCLPQLLDWQIQSSDGDKAAVIVEWGLSGAVLNVLWLNGNANGNSHFLLLPQLLELTNSASNSRTACERFWRSGHDRPQIWPPHTGTKPH